MVKLPQTISPEKYGSGLSEDAGSRLYMWLVVLVATVGLL